MRQKCTLVFVIMIMSMHSYAQTITAVLNTNASSSTPLTFLRTCASNENPVLKIKLWQSGSGYSVPVDRNINIQWFEYHASGNVQLDDRVVGTTQFGSATAGEFDLTLRDLDIQFQWPAVGGSVNTSSIDRYNGVFYARVRIIDLNTSAETFITTNFITIEEGSKPIPTINGSYNTTGHYNVLSGCNSGDVMLKLHSSQTCGLDAFSINIWQTDGFGNDIGSHYFRALTSGEISNLIPAGSGFNIKSLNSAGGSGNGTITMSTGNYYSIALEYKGQNTTQVAYISVHYKAGDWDLVIADNFDVDAQAGYEPTDKWDNNVFSSPSLWNKLSTTGSQSNGLHENPDFVTNPSNTNRMMFKVKNVGCAQSDNNVPLRLFWTRARTGDEPWNKVWLYDMTNNTVLDPDNTTPRVGGSEITITSPSYATPYKTSSAPFLLPQINGGATYTVSFANGVDWYPPNPAWYTPANGSMSSDGAYPIICLLARINENNSAEDPIAYQPTGTTDAILPYVKNNNNVATRNTWLVNTPQHVATGQNWHHGWASVLVTNPSNRAQNVNICVDLIPDPGTSGTFLSHGSIQIATTNNLSTYWAAGGNLTTAVTQNSTTVFTITNGTHACLNHVLLPANAREQIGLRFNFNASSLPGTPKDFAYQLSQVQLDSIEGDTISFDTIRGSDVVYLVNVPIESPVPADTRFSVGVDRIKDVSVLQVYPNPGNHLITVNMKSEAEGSELSIVDIKGQVIRLYKYRQTGDIVETIDTNQLPGGIYFITYRSGDKTETIKISVMH